MAQTVQPTKRDKAADFFRLLRPHLRVLREQAKDALSAAERRGLLHRREMTVADLVDEVIARAWDRFPNRPQDVPLDQWLSDLLHETLREWTKQEPRRHVSLKDRAEDVLPQHAPEPHELEQKEQWWEELPLFEETAELEDVIPTWRGVADWDRLGPEERRARLLDALHDLTPAQRQAFLLRLLENYEPTNIGAVQNRRESEVRTDIEAVGQTLRDRLRDNGNKQ